MSDTTNGNNSSVQQGYDQTLATNVIFNAAVGIILFFVFIIMRRMWKDLYQPRCLPRVTRRGRIQPPRDGLFSWIISVIKYDEAEMVKTHGPDFAMYSRFLKAIVIIIGIYCIYGLVILWPVNATGGNNKLPNDDPHKTSGSGILSLSNVPQGPRFAAHIIGVFFNTVVAGVVLARLYKMTFRDRRVWMKQRLIGNRTVMVTDLPRAIADDHKKAREYFEALFPGEILAVKIVPQVPGLMDLKDERFKMVTKLEKAEAEHIKKGVRPTTRTTFWNPKTKTDAIDYYREQISQIEHHMYSYIATGADSPKKWKQLLHIKQSAPEDPDQIRSKTGSARSSAISKKLPKTLVCFLIFNDPNKASLAAQSSMSALTGKFSSQWAPEPADLYWNQLHIGSMSRAIRRALIWIFMFFVIFFNSIPILAITGLFNLKAISETTWGKGFANAITNNATANGIVTGVLPPLVILVYFSLIPKFIHFLCDKEGHYSYSSVERSMLSKYFVFVMINIFFVSLLASGFWKIIQQLTTLAQNPTSLVTLLANSLPLQAPYFINYVLTSAIIAHFLFLIRPGDIIVYELKKRFLAKSTRDFRNLNMPPTPWITPRLTMDLLMFVIIIVYSTIAPLILPFGLIYFIFAYIATKYNLLYVYEIPWESGANLWPNMFSRMMVGLMIYQITLTGIFAIFLSIPGAIICALILLATILFTVIMHRIYDHKFEYGALDDTYKSDIVTEVIRLRKLDKQLVDYDHPVSYNWEEPEVQTAASIEDGRNRQMQKLGKSGRDLLPLGETVGPSFNGTVAMDRSNGKFPGDIVARMQAGGRVEEKRIPHVNRTTDLPRSEDEISNSG